MKRSMNRKQHQAAINSLAAELHRLAHAQDLRGDKRVMQESFNLVCLFRAIPDLCSANIAVLVEVVFALQRLPETDHEERPLSIKG